MTCVVGGCGYCVVTLLWGGGVWLYGTDTGLTLYLGATLFALYISYVLLGNKETFLVNQTVIRFLTTEGDKVEKCETSKEVRDHFPYFDLHKATHELTSMSVHPPMTVSQF